MTTSAGRPDRGSSGSGRGVQEILADVISRLKGTKRSGKDPNQYMACCPAHDDSDQSLAVSIGQDGDRVVLHCFVGCELRAIAGAIGMETSDLFVQQKGELLDPPLKANEERYTPPEEWERIVPVWAQAFKNRARTLLSRVLDLPDSVFEHFPHLGARSDHPRGSCWTHPEVDAVGRVIGVSLRFNDSEKGNKQSAAGSKRGLAVPEGWKERPGPLFIVEGLSDTMALTAAGLAAIGRPGVAAGVQLCADFIELHVPPEREVIVVGENDERPSKKDPKKWEWPGRDNTRAFTVKLSNELKRDIKMCMPPNNEDKDARKFLVRLEADGVPWGDIKSNWLHLIKPERVTNLHSAPASLTAQSSTGKSSGESSSGSKRFPVKVDGNHEHQIRNEVLAVLAEHAEDLYQRDGKLVQLVPENTPGVPPRLFDHTPASMRNLVTQYVDFVGTRKNELVSVAPYGWIAPAVLERQPFTRVRPIIGVTTAPILRPDGALVQDPGYDAISQLYYCPAGAFDPVPESPTREDARRAIRSLLSGVEQFPFVSDADRCAWVALVLTLVGRAAIAGPCPFFFTTANAPGSGKSTLINAAALIATGHPALMGTYPVRGQGANRAEDEDEVRKVTRTCCIAGHPVFVFDNIPTGHQFGSAALDAVLTMTINADRTLGASVGTPLPARTVYAGTGNQIGPRADTVRRVVGIRLNDLDERPEERLYSGPEVGVWALQERAKLLSAALTVLRAYICAGRPAQGLAPMGSFESWSDLVRSALVWAGHPDCRGTRDQFVADDPERRAAVAFVDLLTAAGGDKGPVTAGQVVRAVNEDLGRLRDTPGLTGGGFEQRSAGRGFNDFDEEDLPVGSVARAYRRAMPEAAPNPKRLGEALRRYRDRTVNGRRITRLKDTRTGTAQWQVLAVGDRDPAPGAPRTPSVQVPAVPASGTNQPLLTPGPPGAGREPCVPGPGTLGSEVSRTCDAVQGPQGPQSTIESVKERSEVWSPDRTEPSWPVPGPRGACGELLEQGPCTPDADSANTCGDVRGPQGPSESDNSEGQNGSSHEADGTACEGAGETGNTVPAVPARCLEPLSFGDFDAVPGPETLSTSLTNAEQKSPSFGDFGTEADPEMISFEALGEDEEGGTFDEFDGGTGSEL